MLQFRPGGRLYEENDVGWVFRGGRKFVCRAREVQVGDVLPDCDVFDERYHSIRVLIPVKMILDVQPNPSV